MISANDNAAGSVLFIDGEMTIYHAAELKELLLARLARTQTLDVDLAGVTELDSAGVQVLMLAKKTAQETQRELRLIGHSPEVLKVFELLNLGAYFGDLLLMTSAVWLA